MGNFSQLFYEGESPDYTTDEVIEHLEKSE